MSKVVMHNVVSVDGFIADANDDIGPLLEWYGNGDTSLDEGGEAKVSRQSYDYFGLVDNQHLLEDPDVVIQGDRVLHLHYCVRREL